MTDNVTDINVLKDRRTIKAIENDEANWERVEFEIVETLVRSELSDGSITSVALAALIEVLGCRMSVDEAKTFISERLRDFE